MRLPPNAQSCISCIDSCIQLLFSGRMGAAVHAGVVNDPGVAEGLSRAGDVLAFPENWASWEPRA